MISNFWSWIVQSVTAAVSILNTLVSDSTLSPFFNLFLVVIALMVIVKYILKPIFGSAGSDKARKKTEDKE